MQLTRRQFGRAVGMTACGAIVLWPSGVVGLAIEAVERDDIRRRIVDTLWEAIHRMETPHAKSGCPEITVFPCKAVSSAPSFSRSLQRIFAESSCRNCRVMSIVTAFRVEEDPARKLSLYRTVTASGINFYRIPLHLVLVHELGPLGKPILEQLSQREDDDALLAMRSLIELGDRSFLPRLRAMLDGPQYAEAAELLWEMDDRESIPSLREILSRATSRLHSPGDPANVVARILLQFRDVWTERHLLDLAKRGSIPANYFEEIRALLNLPPYALEEETVAFLRHREATAESNEHCDVVDLLLVHDRTLPPSRVEEWARTEKFADAHYSFGPYRLWHFEGAMEPRRFDALLHALMRSPIVANRCLAAHIAWRRGDLFVLPSLRRDLAAIPRGDKSIRYMLCEPMAEIPDPAIRAWVRGEIARFDVARVSGIYAVMAKGGDRESLDILASALSSSERPLCDRVQIAAALSDIVF